MWKKLMKVLFSRRVFIILFLLLQAGFMIFMVKTTTYNSELISMILTVLSFFAIAYIIGSRDKSGYKLIWIILIVLFPLFGGLFYLLFKFQSYGGGMSGIEKVYRGRFAEMARKCESLSKKVREENRDASQLVSYLTHTAGFPLYEHTYAEYQTPGEVHFVSLVEELKKAKRFIFLEYFIIEEGKMWNTILEILVEKLASGVEVRVIYDDMGSLFKLPPKYYEKLRALGLKAIAFNHFKPVWSSLQNNRDHRKIAVIDGEVAFTGGNNLADEYINETSYFGKWKDASIMIKGEAVRSFTLMFLQMWNLGDDTDRDNISVYLNVTPEASCDDGGIVIPYSDSPMDRENVGEHVYRQIIANAKEYLYIDTPYLIVDDNMVSDICLAAKSGIDVRIVTPHIPDKLLVHMTTHSFYPQLIRSGVRIYEYTPGFMHSKIFVSDDNIATVGTINLDYRSMYLSFECGVWMYKNKAVMDIKRDFLDTLAVCTEITEQDIKYNPIKHFIHILLKICAPIM